VISRSRDSHIALDLTRHIDVEVPRKQQELAEHIGELQLEAVAATAGSRPPLAGSSSGSAKFCRQWPKNPPANHALRVLKAAGR
jgi:hypothetical protein